MTNSLRRIDYQRSIKEHVMYALSQSLADAQRLNSQNYKLQDKYMFLAHLSRSLKVSYCDQSPSVVVVVVIRLSVRPQSLNNISS